MRSTLVEQTTPFAHLIFDAVASASGANFTDLDLDANQLAGPVSWVPLEGKTQPSPAHSALCPPELPCLQQSVNPVAVRDIRECTIRLTFVLAVGAGNLWIHCKVAPPQPQRVIAYRLYMATSAAGANKSQVGEELGTPPGGAARL